MSKFRDELIKDWVFYGMKSPKDIFRPQYRHALLSPLMLVYGVLFFVTEWLALERYHVVHCALDDLIPFNEYFIIFYVIWYPFWIGMLIYTMCFEVPTYKRLLGFFLICYSISLMIYIVYPTGIDMQPTEFENKNFFTWVTQIVYDADMNTSVCPSDHVIGAFAVVFAAADSKRFSGKKSMAVILFLAIMISISITFVKQHSALDILFAAPVIAVGYLICFNPERIRRKREREQLLAQQEHKPVGSM